MSELLQALIEQRRKEAIGYQEYLEKIVALTKQVKSPGGSTYPASMDTSAKQALYDNLDRDVVLAVAVDNAVRDNLQDGWRENAIKTRKVKNAIRGALKDQEANTERILELVIQQHEY
jgi:type I restriction enzyme R subunit